MRTCLLFVSFPMAIDGKYCIVCTMNCRHLLLTDSGCKTEGASQLANKCGLESFKALNFAIKSNPMHFRLRFVVCTCVHLIMLILLRDVFLV